MNPQNSVRVFEETLKAQNSLRNFTFLMALLAIVRFVCLNQHTSPVVSIVAVKVFQDSCKIL